MRSKVDPATKQFESSFLKEFAAQTRLPQTTALRLARERVEDILIMFNDGYSALETARYIRKLVSTEANYQAN